MRRTIALRVATLLASLLVPAGARAGGSRLLVIDRAPGHGVDSVTYLSVDPLAGLSSGGPGTLADVSAEFTVQHLGVGSTFTVPAGAWTGTSGWRSNDGTRATFRNRQAPAGPTTVRTTTVQEGKHVALGARSVGEPPLALAGPVFSGGIAVAYVLSNESATARHCVTFAESECVRTPIGHGTGWKLRCQGGGADPACRAVTTTTTSAPPTTTVTTTTTTSTISPTCGDGVRDPGEQCDGGPSCTSSCFQDIPSCCSFPDSCASAPLFSLNFYLMSYCAALYPGSQPIAGGACAPDGTCAVQIIDPVPQCCQLTGSCNDATATSTADLWRFQNVCRGAQDGTITIGATCGPAGICLSQ